MTLDEIPPRVIAELRGLLGRTDDVGEQDRRQGTVAAERGARSGHELLDLRGHLSGSGPWKNACASPANSTNRAPSMCEARSRAASMLATGSSVRFITRVGTWMLGRTPRMSMSRFIRSRAARAPGVSRSATTCGSVPSLPRTCLIPARAGSEEVPVGHPVLGQVLDLGERLLHGDAPWVVIRPDPRRLRAPQDEAARPLGIRGREDARHAAALGRAEDERALAPRGVHHGADVVGSLFERRRGLRTVAHARPPLVEPDQSSERTQALDQGGRLRDLPEQLQVRDRARGVHEVDRIALARDLIGDHHVAAPRVPRLGTRYHGLTTRLRQDTGASTRHPPPQRDRRATSFLSDDHPQRWWTVDDCCPSQIVPFTNVIFLALAR